jgi:hypothetical protein
VTIPSRLAEHRHGIWMPLAITASIIRTTSEKIQKVYGVEALNAVVSNGDNFDIRKWTSA